MSVVRQDPDLQDAFNELEAKVLLIQEEHKKLRRRVIVLEKLAKKHGSLCRVLRRVKKNNS